MIFSDFYLFIYLFLVFYWILGFAVHEQSMQDSCVGTHMAVCFAFLFPFTHVWHVSPGYPTAAPFQASVLRGTLHRSKNNRIAW